MNTFKFLEKKAEERWVSLTIHRYSFSVLTDKLAVEIAAEVNYVRTTFIPLFDEDIDTSIIRARLQTRFTEVVKIY